MIKIIWVIVLITGSDSSSSLPQTRYPTKEACMSAVDDMLVGNWHYNASSGPTAVRTPSKFVYATCIQTEDPK